MKKTGSQKSLDTLPLNIKLQVYCIGKTKLLINLGREKQVVKHLKWVNNKAMYPLEWLKQIYSSIGMGRTSC